MRLLQTILILLMLINAGCGKKSSLERYPGSDYPKQYPKQNER